MVYRIQFERADLGHLLVDDTDVAIQGEAEVLVPCERSGEQSVLEQQEMGACPRVGQQSAAEEALFLSTWETCHREAIDIHRKFSSSRSNGMELNLVSAEHGLSSLPSTSTSPLTNKSKTPDSFVEQLDRISIVCTACLLFLRSVMKLSRKNEKEAAVFSANTSAFLLDKINLEYPTGDLDLQHKLSMLFVLCQTCTKKKV